MPRDRKLEPAEACEKGRKSMESVVVSATQNCKNMQITDRKGDGLVRMN